MKLNTIIILIMVLLLQAMFLSCKQTEQKHDDIHPQKVDESLVKANKTLVKSEDQQIEDFIARYRWKMIKTGTGLRYMIYKANDGSKAEKGMEATLAYTLRLLNGDICYTSEELGNKTFIIGKGGVEAGLEEGILFLRKGERAKFILPSHLAFGLIGDGNKIPAKATLVYDIELLELK